MKGIRHSVRMSLGFRPAEPRNWKWPNGVGNSEMSIIWCISITNNMKTFKGDVRSSVLKTPKTRKTRETKTWITQNFPIVWPIPGCTTSKSMPRAFQICMTHGGRDNWHHIFWTPKSRQMSTKNFRAWFRYKKLTLLNEASVRFETNSTSCQ